MGITVLFERVLDLTPWAAGPGAAQWRALPNAAFMDSLAGSPAYTPEQKGSMRRSNTSAPRLRRTNCSTDSSKPAQVQGKILLALTCTHDISARARCLHSVAKPPPCSSNQAPKFTSLIIRARRQTFSADAWPSLAGAWRTRGSPTLSTP